MVFILAGRPHRNLHVLPQGGKKIHKALDGEITRAIAHQQRDVRLLDAENFPGLGLRQVASLDEAVNLEREPCLEELLFGMRKTEVSQDITAALSRPHGAFSSRGHVNSFLFGGVVRRQPGAGG